MKAQERRRSARLTAHDLRWTGCVQLSPGGRVTLIDVSEQGLTVEAGRPLPPGASVTVHVQGTSKHSGSALITRCSVCAINSDSGLRYRAGVVFVGNFNPFWEAAAPRENRLP